MSSEYRSGLVVGNTCEKKLIELKG